MFLLSSFLFIACEPREHEGTIVGNPSQTRPSLSKMSTQDHDNVDKDFWYTGTEGVLTSIELIDLDGNSTYEEYNQHMTLLGDDTFMLPPGVWSGMVVSFEDIFLSGYVYEGQTQLIDVAQLSIELYGPNIPTDGNEINFELGAVGWLDNYDGWSNPGELSISESQNESSLSALNFQSALYLDQNGNGIIDESERENALLAAGPDRELGNVDFMVVDDGVTNISSDTGCHAGHSNPINNIFMVFLPFALLYFRRKES
jgi:hypothetical protein